MGYTLAVPDSPIPINTPYVCRLENLTMNISPIQYRVLEPVQIAYAKTHIDTRDQIPPLIDHLKEICGKAAGRNHY